MKRRMSYKEAGVDISAGEEAVRRIKGIAKSTFSSRVLTDLGRFAGHFRADFQGMKEPVLVSSMDGVGTKLKVAFMMKKHDSVGEDLVNHCVNDILVEGARPLFFLDYIGTGSLHPDVVVQIIEGMARGCRAAGCALIGGEMAEMPGFYAKGEYDLVGTIVGVVDKSAVVDGGSIVPGDVLVALPSTGLHTNGFSLARKVLFEKAKYRVNTHVKELGTTVGEALLAVHRCYLGVVSPLLGSFPVKAMAHITGGGIVGNTSRVLPRGRALRIEWNWEVPALFRLIQEKGNVPDEEMRKTFNLGVGYVFIVGRDSADSLMKTLAGQGESSFMIGKVL